MENLQIETKYSILEAIKKGVTTSETFNGVTVKATTANISLSQSLVFANYLSKMCIGKGRNSGTLNDKTLTIISDWFDMPDNKGSIAIEHIYSKSKSGKVNYFQIVYTR